MKIGDLVKRIKNWKPHEANMLGVVVSLESPGMARVFYPGISNAYWEDREWLEVINESR